MGTGNDSVAASLQARGNWDCQCSHPHPIFDHGDQYVYFTSNESGHREVYRVPSGLEPIV